MTAAQLLSAAAQSRSGAARRKQQPTVRAKAPQHQQAAPQQRQTRRLDRTGPSRREEREQPTRRWGGERGFEERGGFLPGVLTLPVHTCFLACPYVPARNQAAVQVHVRMRSVASAGARQPRRAEDEHSVPRYSHHDDRGPPQPQQQVIREIRYVPMPAPAPEPQYAEPPAAWAPPVQSFQPTRQPFQPARQQPPPQYEVPQPRAARQQPQAQYAPAPRAPRGQQMHPLYDDERVAAAGSAGFSDDEMEDAVAGGAIVKEEPAAAARPTAGHWTRHSGRHPANAIGWVVRTGAFTWWRRFADALRGATVPALD